MERRVLSNTLLDDGMKGRMKMERHNGERSRLEAGARDIDRIRGVELSTEMKQK